MLTFNFGNVRPSNAPGRGSVGDGAWLDSATEGPPGHLWGILAPKAAFSLGMLNEIWWETVLPFNVDWASKTALERVSAADDLTVHFGKASWDAMPWGNDGGLWEFRGPDKDGNRDVVWMAWQRYARENVGAKPDWATFLSALKNAFVEYVQENELGHKAALQVVRDSQASASVTIDGEKTLHVGGGIEHMPALMHAFGASSLAGEHFGPATMLNDDGRSVTPIWTSHDAHSLLDQLTAQTNKSESAYNIIRTDFADILERALDTSGDANTRQKATKDLLFFIKKESIEAAFKAAIENSDALPTDLATLKSVLCERVEAEATGRQKYIKGAITQQAIDNWAQCDGIDDALKKVSSQCALACIDIQRATTEDMAKTAFDDGVTGINTVTPLHTPTWLVGSTFFPAGRSAAPISDSKVNVAARHPEGQDIDGNVVISSTASAPIEVSAIDRPAGFPGSAHACKISIKDPKAGETVKVFLTARNLCGPSEMELHLTPAASP